MDPTLYSGYDILAVLADGMLKPLLEPARYGYVASVYVRPTARRGGVLHLLMDAAEQWCREHGLDEVRLHNASDNPLANAAWDALGFQIAEHLRVRSLPDAP